MSRHYKQDIGIEVRPRGSEQRFPIFSKPSAIGFFSINGEREYDPSASQLSYFKYPTPDKYPLDLNQGLQQAIKKPDIDGKIDFLLKYIHDHINELLRPRMEFESQPDLLADFVCYRGLLRLIMCTPYEFQNDWCILATRFNNTIYLCKRDTKQELLRQANETPQQKAMSAWGFKFEQYCLTDSPFSEPNTAVPVNECAEFNCVFRTKLNGIDLLYSGEMDGIKSNEPIDLDKSPLLIDSLKFVELKTCQELLKPNQKTSYFRFKTRNWWCQSFLVGVSDIYKGVRNQNGYIQKIEHIEVRSLPKISKDYWNASVCANFLVQFLNQVRSIVGNTNDPYTTFEFYFNPRSARITYEMRRGKTDYSFLPDWYIELFKRKATEINHDVLDENELI